MPEKVKTVTIYKPPLEVNQNVFKVLWIGHNFLLHSHILLANLCAITFPMVYDYNIGLVCDRATRCKLLKSLCLLVYINIFILWKVTEFGQISAALVDTNCVGKMAHE